MSISLLLLLSFSLSLALFRFIHCGVASTDQPTLLPKAVRNLLLAKFRCPLCSRKSSPPLVSAVLYLPLILLSWFLCWFLSMPQSIF